MFNVSCFKVFKTLESTNMAPNHSSVTGSKQSIVLRTELKEAGQPDQTF